MSESEQPPTPDPNPLPTAPTAQLEEILHRLFSLGASVPGGRPASEPLPRIEDIQRDFPQFEIVALIGRGGMGHVYKARQRTLGRVVALKLLPARLAGSGDFTERFESEARAMARLSHPNIVTIHDYGQTAAGQSYLVMEFIEGTNLAERMRGGRLPAAEALDIASQVCSALDWAHGNGIVHRDVKPANIVIDTAGRVKLADFGVAALIRKGSSMLKLTTSPSAFGSLDYMSPEQRQGQPPDERGDLFSLGVILYEMLCDDLPHGVFTRASRRVGCDHRIDGIIDRAMQQDLPRRYQRAAAMKTDLDTARGVLTLPAVRHLQLSRMLWTVAAAVLVIIVISMVAGDRNPPATARARPFTPPPMPAALDPRWRDVLAELRQKGHLKDHPTLEDDGTGLRTKADRSLVVSNRPVRNGALRVTWTRGDSSVCSMELRQLRGPDERPLRDYHAAFGPTAIKVQLHEHTTETFRPLKKWSYPPGFDRNREHTWEFHASEDMLSVWLDNVLIGSVQDESIDEPGLSVVVLGQGVVVRELHALDEDPAPPGQEQAPRALDARAPPK